MSAPNSTLESIYEQADRLSELDKLKLIARLAESMQRTAQEISADEKRRMTKAALRHEYETKQPEMLEKKASGVPRKSSFGVLADLGSAPSDEDIAEIRRDMMKNFPREDIV